MLACSKRSDSGERCRVKKAMHLSSSLAFIFSRSLLLRTAPHYLNAWNRLNPCLNTVQIFLFRKAEERNWSFQKKKKKSLEGVSDLHTKLWGHVASARKRSHQWCLTLTPKNTETILKNEMSLFSATNQERPYKQLLHD